MMKKMAMSILLANFPCAESDATGGSKPETIQTLSLEGLVYNNVNL